MIWSEDDELLSRGRQMMCTLLYITRLAATSVEQQDTIARPQFCLASDLSKTCIRGNTKCAASQSFWRIQCSYFRTDWFV